MSRLVLPVTVAGVVLLMASATSFAATTVRLVPGVVAQTAVEPSPLQPSGLGQEA